MVGENIKGALNVDARVENTKSTVKGIVSDFKAVVTDVKDRIVDGTPPSFCRQFPGMPVGRTGSLLADVVVLPTALIDRLESHVQGFAQINRRALNRAR